MNQRRYFLNIASGYSRGRRGMERETGCAYRTPRKGRELSHEVTRPQLRAERRKTERLPEVNDIRQLPLPQKPLRCICRGRTTYAPRTFLTEAISRILIIGIGTGYLKCPPLLSPLRCIWGRKHYAPTASGAFVMNGIEQCHRKRFVVFLWHLSSRRMQKQKRPFARADGCI